MRGKISVAGAAEVLKPGLGVGDGGSAFQVHKARLTLRDEPLVPQHDRRALAEPRLEFRVEGKRIQQGARFRRVLFRAIEDGPPASPRQGFR